MASNPNPEHGKRSEFRKFTLTLPKSIWHKLTQESLKRKTQNRPNHMLSEVAREWLLLGIQTDSQKQTEPKEKSGE